ncbi:MAG TPA: phytoene desaturase family protein [Bryobacteraceae bacterium]|nr:phytoene desaturase family protein [Bryobacteraceae bacterium]
MNDKAKPVVVVGAGLGGLTAACTLAARGYRVTVLEKNEWLGGKAAVLERRGFRFDMGPTILTVPSVLRRVFAEAGQRLEDAIDLIPLDPQWRCFFDDGSVLDLHQKQEAMQQYLQTVAPSSAEGYARFIDLSKRLHEISDKYFFWRSVGGIGDTFDFSGTFQISVLRDLMQMRMGSTVAGTIRDFIPDRRLAQLLDHFTQYIGSSPEASPAILCAIAHMQTDEGVWYPRGGTAAVPRALRKLANELDVEFRTGVEVERIITVEGRATAVVTTDGETFEASAVVSNSDAVRTHRELVGGQPAKRFDERRSYEAACSGVVLYLGLEKRYPQLLHHDFVFSRDPHEEFDYIYRRGEPAPDPTCYLAAPSITEPGVAPEGCEALYVLVHTPYLRPHHDWKRMLPAYRRTILDKLSRTAGLEDLEDHIVVEETLTPQDIHDRYRVLNGAIYGIASHGRFTGAFKPANRSKDVEGLYLAGGAAHPGPGMPMVMMSGWIAADTLDHDRVAVPERTACVTCA